MGPQSQSVSATLPRADEIAAADLLDVLARHADKPLIFRYDGRDVLPGYHVTEVVRCVSTCSSIARTAFASA
jgi:hypothetical protein